MPVGKRPYCIRMEDESPFFIGGTWDVWHAREKHRLYTFTVLTTFPNDVSATVHDRMPVIVQPGCEAGQRESRDCTRKADVPKAHPRAALLDRS